MIMVDVVAMLVVVCCSVPILLASGNASKRVAFVRLATGASAMGTGNCLFVVRQR